MVERITETQGAIASTDGGNADPGTSGAVSVAAVRYLLRQADAAPEAHPELGEQVRPILVAASRERSADEMVELAALEVGAPVRSALLLAQQTVHEQQASSAHDAVEVQPTSLQLSVSAAALQSPAAGSGLQLRNTGILSHSSLNPGGRGNAAEADPLWRNLGLATHPADDRGPRVDPNNHVADPNTVMEPNTHTGVHPEIRDMFLSGAVAPHAAEAIAAKLLELYGPYHASNHEANLRGIIANLRWIADTNTGISYEYARAESNSTDTYAPNYTISVRRGVCRDIHVAVAAMLGGLATARFEGGIWRLGSPASSQDVVQVVAYNNPDEFHAYMVYRDPRTGGWNALEYGRSYELQAANALEAFASLPGYATGFTRYTIRGWNDEPVVNDRGVIGAERARNFFRDNPGEGTAGEVRLTGSRNNVGAAVFLTPRLALVGSMDPSELENGLRAGLKLNWHRNLVSTDKRGYLRIAGGVYRDLFEAGDTTGQRGADRRSRYSVYVIGLQADGRLEGDPVQLAGEHLRLRWGADFDALLGVPIASGGRVDGATVPFGALGDFSNLDLGGEIGFSGRENLGKAWRFDWAVVGRGRVDTVNAGTELTTSRVRSTPRSLVADPWRTSFALAISHQAENGRSFRLEAGGTQFLSRPYDKQTMPREQHYAVLAVSSRGQVVNFGVLARGETLDGSFVPVDGLGVALDLQPHRRVRIGANVQSIFRGGNVRRIGPGLYVTGNLDVSLW